MQILTNALLGIDKMPLQTDTLPPKIAEYLEKYAADSPEASFLMAASLVYAYETAGEMPQKLVVPITQKIAPADTRKQCPEAILAYFNEKNNDYQTHLMVFALNKCLQNNWSLSPNGLISLLNIGKNKNLPLDIKQKIAQVLGEQGAWLAAFNPEWNYLTATETSEDNWNEGNSEQRLAAFTAMRQENPAAALALLETDWSQCAARERKSFLEAIKINLNSSDEPFLEGVYNDILKQKDSDKGIKSELKKQVVDLLLTLPNSKKQVEIFEKMTSYFSQSTFKLPAENDDFFNAKIMSGALGHAKTNPTFDWYSDAEYWFQDLLSLLPPQKWSVFLAKNAEQTLCFFNENMMGSIKKKYAFAMNALGDAIVLHQDKEMAFEYLKVAKTSTKPAVISRINPALFALLTPSNLDFLLKSDSSDIHSASVISEVLTYETMLNHFPKQNWGQITSEFVLLVVANDFKNNYYGQNKKRVLDIFPYLHPTSLAFLQKYTDSLEHNYDKDQIEKNLLQPFRHFSAAQNDIASLV